MKSESNEVDEEKPQPCESTALLNVPQRGLLHLSYWKRLERNFGWRLLFLLWVVQHLMKGLCHRMTMRAVPYVFQAYAVDAPQAQVFQGLIMLPWAVKPILGLGSDLVPVMGFRKGPYMITATLLSIGAFTCIIGSTTSLSATVMCIMLIVLQFSTCDLLSEAQYATKIQEVPNAGPDLLSYVWAGIDIFGLLAMFCSGPILEAYGYRGAFVFAALPAALVLVPVSMGCLQEKRISSEDLTRIRRRYFEQRETCFLCLMMFCGTLVIMCVGFLQRDPCINFAVALVTAMFILGACCVCLTPVVAKANAFSVLYTGFNASISGATFYFYTDSKDIYPAGPHFSDFFFNTVLGTVGSVFALLGILFYQQYLSSMSYRKLIVFTSLIMFACSLLDVMMFARLNVHWGIPDHYMVLGLSIFEGVVMQWQWMPQVVLLAALAPRGMEATMLALLAGCHNLGATLGSNFGAVLLEILHVKPRGRSGDAQQFENLWMAAAISSVLLLLVALFLQYLLPDCRQTEKITETNPTENSLLRRWLKS